MPYASKAQMRHFHADPKLQKVAPEWDKATPHPSKLPERLHPLSLKEKLKRGSSPLGRKKKPLSR